MGKCSNKKIRNDILKNHFNRKDYLHLIKQRDIILANKEYGTSKRVKDILERL